MTEGVTTAPIEAIMGLVPRSEATLQIIGCPDFWGRLKKPYEESLVAGFAAVVERDTLGQLSEVDVQNTAALCRWILAINPANSDDSADAERGVLLKDYVKRELQQRLDGLLSAKAANDPNWSRRLLAVYRGG